MSRRSRDDVYLHRPGTFVVDSVYERFTIETRWNPVDKVRPFLLEVSIHHPDYDRDYHGDNFEYVRIVTQPLAKDIARAHIFPKDERPDWNRFALVTEGVAEAISTAIAACREERLRAGKKHREMVKKSHRDAGVSDHHIWAC